MLKKDEPVSFLRCFFSIFPPAYCLIKKTQIQAPREAAGYVACIVTKF